jgi:spoIIIJ-associated protein
MEWVETTGKTVEEAVEAALDQLGVDRAEADIEILDEPKTGLFGRVRTEARIRARVAPVKPRAKEERRERKPKATAEANDAAAVADDAVSATKPKRARAAAAVGASAVSAPVSAAAAAPVSREPRAARAPRIVKEPNDSPANEQIAAAGESFLDGLVKAFGLNGTVSTHTVAEGITEFRISGPDLGVMIGPKAQTLTAIQDLLRTVVYYQVDGDAGRLLLDVGGYRERRRLALEEFTKKVAAEVLASGQSRALEPMSPADRKVVHDTASGIDGIVSLSEGEDAARRVVLSLAS